MFSAEDNGFRVLIPRQDMTGAERAWANRYEVGDIVRYIRGSKAEGVEPGSHGTVIATNSPGNVVTVQKQSGESVSYDPRRLFGVSVYREIQREFAQGDRVQFTAPDKALGVSNRDMVDPALLQLRVLRFCLLVDGSVRISILPEGEKGLVSGQRTDAGSVGVSTL